jgi:two-component system cell cycle response regulator
MLLLNGLFEKVMSSSLKKHISIEKEGVFYFLCPVFNDDNKISAILLSSSHRELSNKKEELCLGMLKIYSNYLNLLNNTQRDKLTGLFNRETLDHQILRVLHQSVPIENKLPNIDDNTPKRRMDKHKETYLGLIDIDHFKNINDTYGHLYGDEILVLVARCMTNNFTRSDDLVYRYGGEEFVILIKADDEHNAKLAFERLRKNIQDYVFPQVGTVTVSIGFEQVTTQQSPQEVIAAADNALYFAKRTGRNKVESYQELVLSGKVEATNNLVSEDITLF